MPRVKGKVALCICEKYQTYFKSIQGFRGKSLFDRYASIESTVNNVIGADYCHFLAEPVIEGDSIHWFSKFYNETPQRLTEIQGDDYTRYNRIKNNSIEHYKNVISILINEGKTNESEILQETIKFVNDDFIYCYDGIVVLGIWGMQLRDNVREPLGIAVKNLFSKQQTSPIKEEAPNKEPEIQSVDPTKKSYIIKFNGGNCGDVHGVSEITKNENEIISEHEIPEIKVKDGYEFIGWDKNPKDYNVTNDSEFTAQYRSISAPPLTKLPWYKRIVNWLRKFFFGRGCLKWLWWLLLLLLLLLLFFWLFKGCNEYHPKPIPNPIANKPWIHDDPNAGRGGIYNPGNPYEQVPTPPEYKDVLPPNQGVLPPIDTSNIIRPPGQPTIISNRLNILMENENKSILDLAKEFKIKYPDDKYKVVYYDDVVRRMQIEVPSEERTKLKAEIPSKFSPEYTLYVFDEALFRENYIPNDPDFNDTAKSWYLKAINAPQAWDITRGSKNLTIAIVDNGFSLKHPELNSKVVMPYNVWTHSPEIFSQKDNHGTHVAGTSLAIMNNGIGICGIAPECAFMPVQVANKQGIMTTTSVLDGVLYALYQGADVINISLGTEFEGTLPDNVQRDLQDNHFKEEEHLWNEVMKISNKHNAIIVLAAGNDNMLAGINPMNRPKNYIIVSALDKNNNEYQKAGFSNFGHYSTVSAPGVSIYSCVGNSDYATMDGTSMAAPMVTGTVALMKSLNENLTAVQIICILQNTGLQANGRIGNLIQVDQALKKVQSGLYTDCDNDSVKPSSGDVQVLLEWGNYNDLDLAVVDPEGNTVWFKNKQVPSGGQLEIDMNVEPNSNKNPIENIFWPRGSAPNGTYEVYLWLYKQHIPTANKTSYKITVQYGGKTEVYPGNIKREDGRILVCTFTLGSNSKPQLPNDPNKPPSNNNREMLQKERDRLQRQLEDIDQQLRGIDDNSHSKK